LLRFQTGSPQGGHELLHGQARRGVLKLAIQPEPDRTVVHRRLKVQLHKTSGTRRCFHSERQIQTTRRIVGKKMLNIPDQLAAFRRIFPPFFEQTTPYNPLKSLML
jgi:hypothetical protein